MEIVPIHFSSIDSTNRWARENFSHFDFNTITRITADEQTQGRGRFGRPWISPKGVNLYVTYFFTIEKTEVSLGNLSQLFCLSVVKLLCKQDLPAKIKWPNDVIVNGKKISGALCELIDLRRFYGVIAGMGINVNMSQEQLDLLDQVATSLAKETGRKFLLTPLLTLLDQFVIEDLTVYRKKGFQPFHQIYDSFLLYKGEKITLQQKEKRIEGVFHSLNLDGSLNLKLDSGEMKTFNTTDRVFLRKK